MKIGNIDINSVKIGNTTVNKVYIGADQVFPNEALLLDSLTASSSYSLRKLRTLYTGYAIKVRRASDNNEQNIGFLNNQLDTTTLNTFCSGTNGFVTTWYDQSGNANNAIQTTATRQPKIYDSTSGVLLRNSKPSMQFSSAQWLISPNSSSLNVTDGSGNDFPINIFSVYDLNGSTGGIISKDDGGSSREFFLGFFSSKLRFFVKQNGGGTQISKDNFNTTQNNFNLMSAFYDGSKNVSGFTMFQDGSAATLGNTVGSTITGIANTSANLYIGTYINGSNNFAGFISEINLFLSDQTSNRTTIETNINNNYTIY